MANKVWRMHTGSAPGCQSTPAEVVRDWFGGETPRLSLAKDCLEAMVEAREEWTDEEMGEHRCFSRREYVLSLDDVKDIIRGLKAEARAGG